MVRSLVFASAVIMVLGTFVQKFLRKVEAPYTYHYRDLVVSNNFLVIFRFYT